MTGYRRIWSFVCVLVALTLASCGGGTSLVDSGAGESGVGGTGITFARGQIVSVDDGDIGSQQITVSSGDQSSVVASDGSFSLANVPVTNNRIALSFSNGNGRSVVLSVDSISPGDEVSIQDIRINFPQGLIEAGLISTRSSDSSGAVSEDPATDSGTEQSSSPDDDSSSSGQTGDSGDSGEDGGDQGPEFVVVCHFPGTPAEQTLRIPTEALDGHLGHGDTLGMCP